ncbi:uncharacterized protein [Dysidea avara]|uniref:uncharacterized protein isoform X2 n=1 Tax=Dysidea avara TaxID=196820 RepID=UPI00331AF985
MADGVVKLEMPYDEKPDMKYLGQVLTDYCEYWEDIGAQLELRTGVLDNIKSSNTDNRYRFREVIKKWLKMDPKSTWYKLELSISNAIRGTLGLPRLPSIYLGQPQDHGIQTLSEHQLTNNWYSKGANENPEEVVPSSIAKITKKTVDLDHQQVKIAEQPQGHDIQSLHFGQQLTNNWYSKGANENPEEVVQFIIAKITKKIVEEPKTVKVFAGGCLELLFPEESAHGVNIIYLWFRCSKDGLVEKYLECRNSKMVISNVTSSHEGYYKCILIPEVITSRVVYVEVISRGNITQQPLNQHTEVGKKFTTNSEAGCKQYPDTCHEFCDKDQPIRSQLLIQQISEDSADTARCRRRDKVTSFVAKKKSFLIPSEQPTNNTIEGEYIQLLLDVMSMLDKATGFKDFLKPLKLYRNVNTRNPIPKYLYENVQNFEELIFSFNDHDYISHFNVSWLQLFAETILYYPVVLDRIKMYKKNIGLHLLSKYLWKDYHLEDGFFAETETQEEHATVDYMCKVEFVTNVLFRVDGINSEICSVSADPLKFYFKTSSQLIVILKLPKKISPATKQLCDDIKLTRIGIIDKNRHKAIDIGCLQVENTSSENLLLQKQQIEAEGTVGHGYGLGNESTTYLMPIDANDKQVKIEEFISYNDVRQKMQHRHVKVISILDYCRPWIKGPVTVQLPLKDNAFDSFANFYQIFVYAPFCEAFEMEGRQYSFLTHAVLEALNTPGSRKKLNGKIYPLIMKNYKRLSKDAAIECPCPLMLNQLAEDIFLQDSIQPNSDKETDVRDLLLEFPNTVELPFNHPSMKFYYRCIQLTFKEEFSNILLISIAHKDNQLPDHELNVQELEKLGLIVTEVTMTSYRISNLLVLKDAVQNSGIPAHLRFSFRMPHNITVTDKIEYELPSTLINPSF